MEDLYIGSFAKQELEGEFTGFEGLVYPGFSYDTHVIQTRPELRYFKRVQFWVDWGFTNPMVLLEVGLTHDNDIYILKEFYQKKIQIEEFIGYALERQKAYTHLFEKAICDPAEPGFIEAFNNKQIYSIAADNAIMEGITLVTAKLQLKENGKPQLFIHESCVNVIKEFLQYRYPNAKDEKPVQENPLKINDHAMDVLRYGIMDLKDAGDLPWFGVGV